MKHYLKIENNKVIEAPFQVNRQGFMVYGYNHQNNESMLFADGYSVFYFNVFQAEILDGKICKKKDVIAEKTLFSKLEIRRKLRQAGLQQTLNDLLQSNDQFQKDWNDAVEIDLNEQTIANAIQAGLITKQMIDAIRS